MRADRARHRTRPSRSSAPTPPLAADAAVVHPELGSTTWPASIPAADDPELDAIFASAAHVVTETFTQHRYLCVPMETRGIVSQLGPARGRASPCGSRRRVPTACAASSPGSLGVPEHRIRVDHGRRRRRLRPEDVHAARRGRRRRWPASGSAAPVKWIEDRRENLMSGQHARDDRDDRQLRRRRRRPDPGRAGRPRRRRRLVRRRRQQRHRLRRPALPRAVQDPAGRLLGHGRLHEHLRALLVPRPVDDGDGWRASR